MEGLPTYFGVCSLLQDKFREYSHSPEAASKETSPGTHGRLSEACLSDTGPYCCTAEAGQS